MSERPTLAHHKYQLKKQNTEGAILPHSPVFLKEFLATRQRIPRLGNGVLQDILWTARVHPRRRLADCSRGEIGQIYRAVKEVLREMTDCGGRDTERDLFGSYGGYRTILSKNTLERPCPACGGAIHKEAFLGGNIYYCAGCQGKG